MNSDDGPQAVTVTDSVSMTLVLDRAHRDRLRAIGCRENRSMQQQIRQYVAEGLERDDPQANA